VIITKFVSGDPPSATYEIGLVGPAPATTEHWRTIKGAGEVTFSGLAVGTYTVVERDPGSNYTVTISPKTITVTSGDLAKATMTNADEIVEFSAASLPPTGSIGGPAIVTAGLTLMAGGTALAELTQRRKIS
jgi:hypothetical protein